jgi:1-acyl-sn-glycerol-3-phosphate acyltransferase
VPNVKRVGMSFGEPMYFDGDPTDLEHLRDVADTIMRAIGQLSGQEYVDTYAPKKVRLGKVEEEE